MDKTFHAVDQMESAIYLAVKMASTRLTVRVFVILIANLWTAFGIAVSRTVNAAGAEQDTGETAARIHVTKTVKITTIVINKLVNA